MDFPVLRAYVGGLTGDRTGGDDRDRDSDDSDADSRGTVHARLERLISENSGTFANLARSVQKKFSAQGSGQIRVQDLEAADVTLADIVAAKISPRELIESGIIASLEDCRALGVRNFAALIHDVGSPRHLRKWMGATDWDMFVQALTAGRTPWWSASVWSSVASKLGPRDLEALGVHLDAWFAADGALFERARQAAPDWLGNHGAARWQKHGVISAGTFAKLGAANIARKTLI